jgi:hypothetical protein
MNWKRSVKVLLVAAFLVFSGQQVEAQRRGGGEGGRINRLSGPGPFEAYGAYFTFDPGFRGFFPNDESKVGTDDFVFSEIPVWVGFAILRAVGTDNDLDYAPDFEGSKQVNFWTIEPTIDFRVNQKVPVEIGGGLAVRIYSGEAFETFTRVSPGMRVGVRFLTWAGGNWEGFRLQYEAVFDTQGFTDEDFGAEPGTFDSGSEITHQFLISYDFFY